MLLIFRMGYCSGRGRVIDQGDRVIVPKGKSYCSRRKGFCLGEGGGGGLLTQGVGRDT